MAPSHTDDLMIAGIVGAARGLQGEVSVLVRTDRPEDIFYKGAAVATNLASRPQLVISAVRSHNDRLLLRFEGVVRREDAEELRDAQLLVEPQDEDDAWYESDLQGLAVVDAEGNELGEVTGLLASPAHDLLVVRAEGEEVLVPFVEEIVPEVLVDQGKVVVDAPAGLFPVRDDEDRGRRDSADSRVSADLGGSLSAEDAGDARDPGSGVDRGLANDSGSGADRGLADDADADAGGSPASRGK